MVKIVKNTHPFFTPIWLIQIWLIIEMFINVLSFETSLIISLIRYLVFLIASVMLINSLIHQNSKLNIITQLFFIWVTWLILSSLPELFNEYRNYIHFKQFIGEYFFMYLTIFIISSKLNIEFYRKIFKFSYYLIIIYLLISVPLFPLFIQDRSYGAEGYTSLVSAGSILVLTLPYHSKKKRNLIIIASIVAIILMMILARRNKVLYFGLVLFFTYLINIFSRTTFGQKKKIAITKSAIVILLFGGIILLVFSDVFDLFWNRLDSGMESREDVIDLFIKDFNRTPQDWIWGRGIFGLFDGGVLATEDFGLRGGIENGYYQTFLKGGGVFLILLTLICINAIYKGFFKSNNILCKGFASLLVVFYFSMIGMNQYGLHLKSIMIFIAISACNSVNLRGYSDQYLADNIGIK